MKVKRLNKLAIILCTSIITVLMSSCAPTSYYVKPVDGTGFSYTVSINGFGNYNIKGKTYYIESGDENISNNDLEFKEYAEYLKIDLTNQQAKETNDKENADMCILMNYGIYDKSYQESIPIPEYGRTTVSSTTTKGSTTTYNYNYGTTGYHYVQQNVSSFLRIVNLYAYDNKAKDSEPIMLWKTNLKSEGSNSDLRKVIPHMIFACNGMLGHSTDGEKEISVDEDGHLINCWKQGLYSNPNFYKVNKEVSLFNFVLDHTYQQYSNGILHFYIDYVIKQDNETIICLEKNGPLYNYESYYSISSNVYLKTRTNEVQLSYVDDYILGTPITDKHDINDRVNSKFFILHFPISLDDADTFEIIEYTNSNHTKWKSWGIVDLKK